ncbi:ABC transporter substrate-binding protein [Bordetella tumbae]|uniref:Bug family tripartite tricarboxylate transporter substrate binding protein n=1 Tax=Bordetella tumbae TaxID=1649139 RepID=UPI0039F0C009
MKKIALLALIVPFLFGAAHAAEQYPARPITFVVPFPPGGATDLAARTLARNLTDHLGATVIVQNKAGASGIVGTQYVANAKPDGYTLLFGASGTLATNPWIYKKLPYSEQSFEPIGAFSESPLVLALGKHHDFRNLEQLLAYARQHPGDLNVGSAGPGSAMNLANQLLQQMTKTKMTDVPFRGSTDGMTALLSGNIDFMFDYAVSVAPKVQSGSLAALATTANKRLHELPDVPTFAELGYPEINLRAWFGLLVPAGTPRDAVTKLETALQMTLNDPEFEKAIENQNSVVVKGLTGPAFGDFIAAERLRWRDLIKAAGVVPQ